MGRIATWVLVGAVAALGLAAGVDALRAETSGLRGTCARGRSVPGLVERPELAISQLREAASAACLPTRTRSASSTPSRCRRSSPRGRHRTRCAGPRWPRADWAGRRPGRLGGPRLRRLPGRPHEERARARAAPACSSPPGRHPDRASGPSRRLRSMTSARFSWPTRAYAAGVDRGHVVPRWWAGRVIAPLPRGWYYACSAHPSSGLAPTRTDMTSPRKRPGGRWRLVRPERRTRSSCPYLGAIARRPSLVAGRATGRPSPTAPSVYVFAERPGPTS